VTATLKGFLLLRSSKDGAATPYGLDRRAESLRGQRLVAPSEQDYENYEKRRLLGLGACRRGRNPARIQAPGR
jgi:hypothetical protein